MSLAIVSVFVHVTTWPAEQSCVHRLGRYGNDLVRWKVGRSLCGIPPRQARSPCFRSGWLSREGLAGRMLTSQSGLIVRRRRGAVVIIAPLFRTALASSGDVWMSSTIIWARAWLCVAGLWLVLFGSWSDGSEWACGFGAGVRCSMSGGDGVGVRL